jgi:hypothetical protein
VEIPNESVGGAGVVVVVVEVLVLVVLVVEVVVLVVLVVLVVVLVVVGDVVELDDEDVVRQLGLSGWRAQKPGGRLPAAAASPAAKRSARAVSAAVRGTPPNVGGCGYAAAAAGS